MLKNKGIITVIVYYCCCYPFLFSQSAAIICSNSILRDITKNIAGDQYEVLSIVPIGSDPHTYEPTPKDVKILAEAQIIILNGMLLEPWLEKIIDNSGHSARIVIASNNISPRYQSEHQNSLDPHAWMNPLNIISYAKVITEELCILYPLSADLFKRNLENYIDTLTVVDKQIESFTARIPKENRIIITMHHSFGYFAERYHMKTEPLMGFSTEADLQIRDILRVSRITRSNPNLALFPESTINSKLLEQMAEDFNLTIASPLYTDSLGDEGGEAGTYIDMILYNALNIYKYLSNDLKGETDVHSKSYKATPKVYLLILGSCLLIYIGILIRHFDAH